MTDVNWAISESMVLSAWALARADFVKSALTGKPGAQCGERPAREIASIADRMQWIFGKPSPCAAGM